MVNLFIYLCEPQFPPVLMKIELHCWFAVKIRDNTPEARDMKAGTQSARCEYCLSSLLLALLQ